MIPPALRSASFASSGSRGAFHLTFRAELIAQAAPKITRITPATRSQRKALVRRRSLDFSGVPRPLAGGPAWASVLGCGIRPSFAASETVTSTFPKRMTSPSRRFCDRIGISFTRSGATAVTTGGETAASIVA